MKQKHRFRQSVSEPELRGGAARHVPVKHREKRELRGGMLVEFGGVLVLLGIWEAVVRIFSIPPYFLPPPSAVITELARQTVSGDLLVHLRHTVVRAAVSICVGAVVGVTLGLMVGWYRWLEQMVRYTVAATYQLPKTALVPLLIVWFGIGEEPLLVMGFLGVFYPVFINTIAGVKGIDPTLVKAARDFGANDIQLFIEVVLPNSLPMVFAGLKLGGGIAVILVVATEMLFGSFGMGFLIRRAASILEVELVFAGLFTLSMFGVLLFLTLDWLERLAIPWHVGGRKS